VCLDRERDLFVLGGGQPLFLFDDGDPRAEAPLHLSEFEPHIGTAHDYQVLGHAIEREDRAVVQIRDRSNPRHVGYESTPSDIDEDARGTEKLLSDSKRLWFLEAGVPFDDSTANHRAQPLLDVVS